MAEYDIKIDEYVATAMTGAEVFGATDAECEERLRDANAVYIAHCKKCQEEEKMRKKFTVKWSAHTFFGGTYTGERTVYAETSKQAAHHVRGVVRCAAFPDVPVRIESVLEHWEEA